MIEVVGKMYRFVATPDLSRLHEGYSPGGAQDRFSCAFANRMLGNDRYAGAIEFTLMSTRIKFSEPARIVIGGAPCAITIEGRSADEWTVHEVGPGCVVEIRIQPQACRVYMSVAGGLEPVSSMPNRFRRASTPAKRGFGNAYSIDDARTSWEPPLGCVRVLPGPEFDKSITPMLVGRWEIDPLSNGMGLRLNGPSLPLHSFDIRSSPVTDGTIQATASGLIALLRQRGTLGGYPRVLNVIDCDVDRLAQFRPGQSVHLLMSEHAEAQRLCKLQADAIA